MLQVLDCDDLSRNIVTFLNEGELFPLKLTNMNFSRIIKSNESSAEYFTSSIQSANFALDN